MYVNHLQQLPVKRSANQRKREFLTEFVMSRLWASEAAAGGISISQSVMRYFLPFLLFIAWRIFVSDADKESARRKGLRGRERKTWPSVRKRKVFSDMVMMKGAMEAGK